MRGLTWKVNGKWMIFFSCCQIGHKMLHGKLVNTVKWIKIGLQKKYLLKDTVEGSIYQK